MSHLHREHAPKSRGYTATKVLRTSELGGGRNSRRRVWGMGRKRDTRIRTNFGVFLLPFRAAGNSRLIQHRLMGQSHAILHWDGGGRVKPRSNLNYYHDSTSYGIGAGGVCRISTTDGVFATGSSRVVSVSAGTSPERRKRARSSTRQSMELSIKIRNRCAYYFSWIEIFRSNSLLPGEFHGVRPSGVGNVPGAHGCISAALQNVLAWKSYTGGKTRAYMLRRVYK